MKKILALILLGAAGAAHAQGLVSKNLGGGSAGGGGFGDLVDADAGKYHFYVGADLQNPTLSVSDANSFHGIAVGDYYGKFWDVRAGYRLFKVIGIEGHYGFKDQDANRPDRFSTTGYWGVFAVPTANVFNLFELSFPIGWAHSHVTVPVSGAPVGASLHSVAYGARIEVPIQEFWKALPDIRVGGGGMVYYQRSDGREYGLHFGVRYDFGFGSTAPPAEPPPEPSPQVVPEVAPPPPPPPPPPCQPPGPGQHVDLSGCKTGDTIVLHGVNFDFNKATLTVNAKTLLDEVADALTKRPDIKVEIDGYTDGKGGDAYNLKLSERRAESVKQYLVFRNIDAGRLSSKGFGKANPVGDNNTDEGREANRRVELKVTESNPPAEAAPAAAPAEAAPAAAPADAAPAAAPADAAPAPAPADSGTPPPADSGSAPAPADSSTPPASGK